MLQAQWEVCMQTQVCVCVCVYVCVVCVYVYIYIYDNILLNSFWDEKYFTHFIEKIKHTHHFG